MASFLYVEDDPALRSCLKATLDVCGDDVPTETEIVILETGEQALHALREKIFCLVLTDHDLGFGPDGVKVAEEALKNGAARVIINSANPNGVPQVNGRIEVRSKMTAFEILDLLREQAPIIRGQ